MIFSCVKKRWLDARWAGRELNLEAIKELQSLRKQNGLDLCGEEGEYHTLVTDAPDFQRRLEFGVTRVCEREDLAHLEIEDAQLTGKT